MLQVLREQRGEAQRVLDVGGDGTGAEQSPPLRRGEDVGE
jgi:hypothetical protein